MIDGYNFINAWGDLKSIAADDLDSARKKLIDVLADFSGYKGYRITVVFDSHLVKGASCKKEVINSIEVVFTKEGETADSYIEKYVHDNAKFESIIVVTSDYLEQLIILGEGAIRMPPRELIYEIENYKKELDRKRQLKVEKNKLEDKLDKSIIEILEKFKKTLD